MSVQLSVTYGQRIKRWRSWVGLRQNELAKKLGCKPGELGKAERGELSADRAQGIYLCLNQATDLDGVKPLPQSYFAEPMHGEEGAVCLDDQEAEEAWEEVEEEVMAVRSHAPSQPVPIPMRAAETAVSVGAMHKRIDINLLDRFDRHSFHHPGGGGMAEATVTFSKKNVRISRYFKSSFTFSSVVIYVSKNGQTVVLMPADPQDPRSLIIRDNEHIGRNINCAQIIREVFARVGNVDVIQRLVYDAEWWEQEQQLVCRLRSNGIVLKGDKS